MLLSYLKKAQQATQASLFDEFSEKSSVVGVAVQCSAEKVMERLRGDIGTVFQKGFDFIYLDPPFNTSNNFKFVRPIRGASELKCEIQAFSDRWEGGIDHYLAELRPSLETAYEALKPEGWLAVHVDWKTDYKVRAMLDEIFGGSEYWKNSLYWKRDPGGKGNKARTSYFPRNADTIFLYNKSLKGFFFNLPRVDLTIEQESTYRLIDEDGRRFKAVDARNYSVQKLRELREAGLIYESSTGKPYRKYFLDQASSVIDMLWTDIPGFGVRTASAEMTGYPTQKPIELVERLIVSLCPEGGIVGDFFSGSGTTAVAAARTGRHFFVADISSVALDTTFSRLCCSTFSHDVELFYEIAGDEVDVLIVSATCNTLRVDETLTIRDLNLNTEKLVDYLWSPESRATVKTGEIVLSKASPSVEVDGVSLISSVYVGVIGSDGMVVVQYFVADASELSLMVFDLACPQASQAFIGAVDIFGRLHTITVT